MEVLASVGAESVAGGRIFAIEEIVYSIVRPVSIESLLTGY